jgi:hypothetical protein
MDGLVDDGFVILGGPVGDGEQTLHMVEAADENDIKARLARDPSHEGGRLYEDRSGNRAVIFGRETWTAVILAGTAK